MNRLYYGDCLTIMANEMKSNSVDLIYLDPPFNSNRAYNAIYKDETGRPLPDQVEAFCDLWTLDLQRERAIRALPKFMIEHGVDDSVVKFWKVWMEALRDTDQKLLAYLSYMVERLVQMKIILRPLGTIYLHCDPTYSHYIKVIMDGIFGHENFRNEIVWSYRRWPAKQSNFQRMHDVILRYSKTTNVTWNQLYEPLAESTLKSDGGKKIKNVFNKAGRRVRGVKSGEDSPGAPMRDVWNIGVIAPTAKERLGYPTQKPLALLEPIIKASSNEGDVVFDPFCGCGTTLEASHRLTRQWIGIDIAIHAIKRVSAVRLTEQCGLVEGEDYEITGVPRTMEGAEDLWTRDTYQFQKWAVEMVDGFVTSRQTRDGGVDGRLYFPSDDDDLKAMKLEVKGGRTVQINDLRALAGVIDEGDFPMGGFITRKTLGPIQKQNFLDFCGTKGDVEIGGTSYPKLQILCIEEILEGKQFNTPIVRGRSSTDQMRLDLSTE